MNILNRALVILLTLAALALITVVSAAPVEMANLAAAWLVNLASWANLLLPFGRIIVAGIGFGLALVLLFWLWLEIRTPNYRTVRVVKAQGSQAEVSVRTLAERLEYAVDSLPDVLKADARLRSYRRNVQVTMQVEIRPGIEVASKVDEIGAAIRTVVEDTMGLALRGRPKVRVEAVRFPKEAFDEPEERAPVAEPAPALPLDAPATPADVAPEAAALPEERKSRRKRRG